MGQKKLEDIKHGSRICGALEGKSMLLRQLANEISVDDRSVQKSLNQLHKNGYVSKSTSGLWARNGV